MNSQFIHLETYSFQRSRTGKPDAADVLREAFREQSHCKHVENPHPNVRYKGWSLKQLLHTIESKRHKIINGRKIRKDARVLLAGVASYPIATDDNNYDRKKMIEWAKKTQFFLTREFKPALKTIVLHEDEKYPHLHFYCIDEDSMSVRDFHPGFVAQDSIKTKNRRAKDCAFKVGFRDFQDRYFYGVSQPLKMQRHNKKRPRLDYAQYCKQHKIESENKSLRSENIRLKKHVKNMQNDLINTQKRQVKMQVNFEAEKSQIYEQSMARLNVGLIQLEQKLKSFTNTDVRDQVLSVIRNNIEKKRPKQKTGYGLNL